MSDNPVIIRPALKRACCDDDACRAAIFNQLLYSIAWKVKQGVDYWYGTGKDIYQAIDRSWGLSKVNKEVNALVKDGLIQQRHNPGNGWDQTWQYLFGEEQAQKLKEMCEKAGVCPLHQMGFCDAVVHLLNLTNAFGKNNKCICLIQQIDSVNSINAFVKFNEAIPKVTTKVITEDTAKDTKEISVNGSGKETFVANATTLPQFSSFQDELDAGEYATQIALMNFLRERGIDTTGYQQELEHLSTSAETVTQVINTEGATDARTSDNHSHPASPLPSDRVGHLDVFAVDTQGTTHANHSPVARDTSPDFSDSRQSGNGVLPLGRDSGMVDRRTQEEARAASQEPLQHTTKAQEVNAQDSVAKVHDPTTLGRIAPTSDGVTPDPGGVPSSQQTPPASYSPSSTTPPSQSEEQPANGTMGVTQSSLLERPAKPEMPPASMKWGAEKMVQITEYELGKYYPESRREKQKAAARKIMGLDAHITEQQYHAGYLKLKPWWNSRKGPLHVTHMAAKTERGEIRILELVDELEFFQQTEQEVKDSHPARTDRANARNTAKVVSEQIVEYNGREMPISEARKLGWHGFENYIGNGPEAIEEMMRVVAEMEASGELARLGLDDIA